MKRIISFKNTHSGLWQSHHVYITAGIWDHFNFKFSGTYEIAITEEGDYRFKADPIDKTKTTYLLFKKNVEIWHICRDQFHKMFFKPDGKKTYSIIVTRKEEFKNLKS